MRHIPSMNVLFSGGIEEEKKSHEIDGVPTNIYLFKVKIETLEKGVKYFQI